MKEWARPPKHFALVAIVAAGLIGCAKNPDPIDRLVADLSASHGLWVNGGYPQLKLPDNASSDEVIKRFFEKVGFDEGHVTNYGILTIREVEIQNAWENPYTAALVETNLGEKIVLFRYEGNRIGWWCRAFDANRIYSAKK
jgi:hypothetical protein